MFRLSNTITNYMNYTSPGSASEHVTFFLNINVNFGSATASKKLLIPTFAKIFADFTHKLPMKLPTKLPTKTAAICSPRYCPRKKRLLPMRFPLISLPSYADRHFLAYL